MTKEASQINVEVVDCSVHIFCVHYTLRKLAIWENIRLVCHLMYIAK